MVFQDSDLAKWLEAVGYSLETHPDPQLEIIADEIIDVIEKAQQPDGYLDTYFILKEPDKKWKNLHECHELYVAGHMMEAAVAYYQGTGKKKLLDIMCRVADNIDSIFGSEPGKIQGYSGHEEVELALVKLYKATGNEKYLKLGQFFIDERGKEPNFFLWEWENERKGYSHWANGLVSMPDFSYNQAHKPVREQDVAIGHAVRAVYLYTGMADIARETGDLQLLEACHRLWNNMIQKQLYITGGIGSTHHGEAFTFDYDLPNDTIYAESCASIGLIFFAHRMIQIELNSVYADVIEQILYNTILGSMSRSGREFFYVNPLEVWPEASEKNPGKHHVKAIRQKWFGCACCPPNIARLLSSLNEYIYSVGDKTLYTHLYIGGDAELDIFGEPLKIRQENQYPWNGDVKLHIVSSPKEAFSIALRIPGWCKNWIVSINGKQQSENITLEKGYLFLNRSWSVGDTIELSLVMSIELMQANPKVRADAGKAAIQRGPLVYCLEETDNGNNLSALSIDPNGELLHEVEEISSERAVIIKGSAFHTNEENWDNNLYKPYLKNETKVEFKAVPYYLWGNRGQGEMLVWIRTKN